MNVLSILKLTQYGMKMMSSARIPIASLGIISLALAMTTAPALADTTRYVCLNNTNNLCLDRPAVGTNVQIDNGAEWVVHNDGHVNCSAGTPFTPGSGLNCVYGNDQIVELENPSNTSMCLRTNSNNPYGITYGGCGAAAELVETTASPGKLIGVYSTDQSEGNTPVDVLTVFFETHGTEVQFYESGASGAYQTWVY